MLVVGKIISLREKESAVEKTYLQLNIVNALTISVMIIALYFMSGTLIALAKKYSPLGS